MKKSKLTAKQLAHRLADLDGLASVYARGLVSDKLWDASRLDGWPKGATEARQALSAISTVFDAWEYPEYRERLHALLVEFLRKECT